MDSQERVAWNNPERPVFVVDAPAGVEIPPAVGNTPVPPAPEPQVNYAGEIRRPTQTRGLLRRVGKWLVVVLLMYCIFAWLHQRESNAPWRYQPVATQGPGGVYVLDTATGRVWCKTKDKVIDMGTQGSPK